MSCLILEHREFIEKLGEIKKNKKKGNTSDEG